MQVTRGGKVKGRVVTLAHAGVTCMACAVCAYQAFSVVVRWLDGDVRAFPCADVLSFILSMAKKRLLLCRFLEGDVQLCVLSSSKDCHFFLV